MAISRKLATRCYDSRAKDYSNSFRNMTYTSSRERDVVLGSLENNDFIQKTEANARELEKKMEVFLERAGLRK